MKILVTGGAGFIGTNIALEARARGHEVVIFDSFIRKDTEDNIPVLKECQIIRGDIRNWEDFQDLPEVDGIINMAANPGIPQSLKNPLYDFKVNALGALHVLEYARHNGKIPVIFASTNKVYSEEINEENIVELETRFEWLYTKGIDEHFPMDGVGEFPHSPYGVSKAAADLYHQEYFHVFGVPTVVNRMSCIYGYYQKGVADQGWISHFVKTIVNGDGKLEFYGNGKQVRDMLWGGDVARLYVDELERIDEVKGKVFNVGGGKANTLSLIEAVRIIEKLSGKKAEIKYSDWRPADQRIYISNIAKVREYLGWGPTISPEEGIQRMINEL